MCMFVKTVCTQASYNAKHPITLHTAALGALWLEFVLARNVMCITCEKWLGCY
ncbi:hypothetical protein Hdeb2414_s0009g00316951 [Helianthus debilis subsp. tardiflorus]